MRKRRLIPLALLLLGLASIGLSMEAIWAEVVVTTDKLTITGGTPPPPKAPFPGVVVVTDKLTITGGTPPPPKPPFPGVTVTTDKLTISGGVVQ